MDVTSKAGLLVQPRHRHDFNEEPTSDLEFGDLLGQFQFSAGSVQGLDNIVVPSNELTVGMERLESASSENGAGTNQDDVAVINSVEKEDTGDDVEQATHLLSDRSKIKTMDQSSEKSESNDKPKLSEDVIANRERNLEQSAAKAGIDQQQLMVANQQRTVTEQQTVPQNVEQLPLQQEVMRKTRRVQNNETQLEQSKDVEFVDGDIRVDKLERALKPETARLSKVESGRETSTTNARIDISDDGGQDLEQMSFKPARKVVSKPVERNQNAETIVDRASQSIGLAGAASSVSSQAAGASVKLSAQARTIGSIAGAGFAKSKSFNKQATAELTRAKTPTPDVELPEDVDKLSVIRQVSDEMKLRFGKNQHVEINLNPVELGRVRIQMQMQSDNSVNLRVSAEHAVIADLLHLNLNQLRRDLLAQGVQVNEVEVNADAHGQGSGDHSDQNESSDGQNGENHDARENGDDQRRQFSVQA